MSNVRSVTMRWLGEDLQFEGAGLDPPSPPIRVDGNNVTGASPMQHLLIAAGGCAGVDVVLILQKMRVRLHRMDVEVTGVRREDDPKRFVSLQLTFTVAGEGLDRAKAERAAQLSVDKYCSVLATLAPDLEVGHDVVLA